MGAHFLTQIQDYRVSFSPLNIVELSQKKIVCVQEENLGKAA